MSKWQRSGVPVCVRGMAIMWAALITAGLAACGGGGGGTSADVGPSATTPLVLTDQNGIAATYLSTSYGELTAALGELSAQWVTAWEGGGVPTRSRTCSNGGTETLTFDDLDHSGTVTPGDLLRVQVQNCYLRWVDAPLSGSAQFRWTSRTDAAHYTGTVTFGSDFVLLSSSATLGVAGALSLQYVTADAVTTLQVTSADDAPLVVTWQGGGTSIASASASDRRATLAAAQPLATNRYRDMLQSIDVSKRIDLSQARITTRLQFRLSSEMLNGQLTVATPTPLVAELGAFPLSGNVWITGAHNARLVMQNTANVTFDGNVEFLLDLQGDGVAEYRSVEPWTDVSIGVFGAAENLSADESAGNAFVSSYPRSGVFDLLSGPRTRATHNTVGTLTWQFSAPLALPDSAQLALTVVAQNGRRHPWISADGAVPVTVTHHGALIQLTPTQPLKPGSTYRLVDRAAGSAQPRIHIGAGAEQYWDYTITVDDVLQADITTAQPGIVGVGFNASLRASRTYAGTAPLSLQWRQVSGPPVLLSSTTADDVTVSLPASGGANGDAVLELETRTTEGDVDLVRVRLPVVGDPLHATQALLSPANGFDVSTPGSTFTTSHRSGFSSVAHVLYGTVNGTVMQLLFGSQDAALAAPYQSGMLMFFIPSGDFVPGTTYTTGVNLTGLVSSWVDLDTCSPDTGTVTIHELVTSPDGTILRLALDFDRNACTVVQAQHGSVRINSDRPLSWQ